MNERSLDPKRIALGVRQPWAELILRGIKTVEIRSTGTRQRGTIYLYASRKPAGNAIADSAVEEHALDLESLPLGRLVGTVELVGSRPADEDDATAACVPAEYLDGRFAWELENPVRLEDSIVPKFLPYGVWFYPFRRRNGSAD